MGRRPTSIPWQEVDGSFASSSAARERTVATQGLLYSKTDSLDRLLWLFLYYEALFLCAYRFTQTRASAAHGLCSSKPSLILLFVWQGTRSSRHVRTHSRGGLLCGTKSVRCYWRRLCCNRGKTSGRRGGKECERVEDPQGAFVSYFRSGSGNTTTTSAAMNERPTMHTAQHVRRPSTLRVRPRHHASTTKRNLGSDGELQRDLETEEHGERHGGKLGLKPGGW